MVEFKELLETCRVGAISNKFNPTEESIWRSLCRLYSKLFHTPLHLALEMAPEHIVLNVYEHQIEDLDTEDYPNLERILDTVKHIEDPEYDAVKRKEQEEFDRQVALEEKERLKDGKAVHFSLEKSNAEKTLLGNSNELAEKRPTSGSINLKYLDNHKNEG